MASTLFRMQLPCSIRIVVKLTCIMAVIIIAIIGIMLVFNVAPTPELRDTLVKTLTAVGIVGAASIAILMIGRGR